MKDIKFRAWWKPAKAMCCVKSIDFHNNKIYISYEVAGTWCEINDVELMQFTGLQDKNGKEIYEGDLVKLLSPYDGEDITAVVKIGKFYDEDAEDWFVGVYLKNHDVCVSIYAEEGEFLESSEVIGNIYENPELLEVKSEKD